MTLPFFIYLHQNKPTMGFNLGEILGTVTSKTAGGILDGLTNSVNSIFNTTADKDKMAQFTSQAQQAIQAELDKHNEALQVVAEQQYNDQLKDVQNARAMEIAMQNATAGSWMSKNIVPMIAVFVNIVWGAVSGYLLLRIMAIISANPNVNMTALMGFYAGLTAIETIIVSFYFGSSKSSQTKDETISSIAKHA